MKKIIDNFDSNLAPKKPYQTSKEWIQKLNNLENANTIRTQRKHQLKLIKIRQHLKKRVKIKFLNSKKEDRRNFRYLKIEETFTRYSTN